MKWVQQMRTEIIHVQDIVDEVTKLTAAEKTSVYFRGQEWFDGKEVLGLRPTIGRGKTFVGQDKEFDLAIERSLLHRFCRYSSLELGRAPGEWEALFLARHHGLPTRLLDWTSNPLFALFSAAQSEKKCEEISDAAVWAIIKKPRSLAKDIESEIDVLDEERKTNIKKSDRLYYHSIREIPISTTKKAGMQDIEKLQKPLRLKGVRIIYPFHVTSRMFMQDSFFTIQDDPWTSLDKYNEKDSGNYLKVKDNWSFVDVKRIAKWKVPKHARCKIVKQLTRIGIDNRKVYPDFDGLAKGLWQLEVIRDL
ncbi:MAG: FRG domain-containing protein [Dehalococcoidales bacterium]|nr:FRG domain-containing protein [Dehalococcoidales bacterium]